MCMLASLLLDSFVTLVQDNFVHTETMKAVGDLVKIDTENFVIMLPMPIMIIIVR